MAKVNVGIVGVGNCASSLVQGICYYNDTTHRPAGLTNAVCAGFGIGDVAITSAFDVDVSKTGLDLAQAIWQPPNNSLKFADVPHLGVAVREGALGDGVGRSYAEKITARGQASFKHVAAHLQQTN